MAIEKEILDELIIDLKKNYEESKNIFQKLLMAILNQWEEVLEKGKTPSLDHKSALALFSFLAFFKRDSETYIKILENVSFTEIIKAYNEKHKEEIKQAEELNKQISEKSKGLYG